MAATQFPASAPPPDLIRMAFRAERGDAEPLGAEWGYGYKCSASVLIPVGGARQTEIAVWSAKVREKLRPAAIGIVRPLRSSDGRYVAAGWRADAWLPGAASPRFDELVAAAVRLSYALKDCPPPPLLTPENAPWDSAQIFLHADAAAFADDPAASIAPGLDVESIAGADTQRALELAAQLAPLRGEMTSPFQTVTADMVGTTLFDGASPPVVTDIIPVQRPAAWPAALTVVDGISWGYGDDGLIARWAHLPDFYELVVRAVLYRLLIHALHPQRVSAAMDGLERVAKVVVGSRERHARTTA